MDVSIEFIFFYSCIEEVSFDDFFIVRVVRKFFCYIVFVFVFVKGIVEFLFLCGEIWMCRINFCINYFNDYVFFCVYRIVKL